ncbi:MAG: type II secretion system F family protein [Comamonadaceae bacterium]|nr:MAG: type II secretion system F family protein [Comamonadaceae bacterium]
MSLLFWIVLCVAASVLLLIAVTYLEYRTIPAERRDYMDPLPRSLRTLWPLVRWSALRCAPLLPAGYRARLTRSLSMSGLQYLFTLEEFVGIKLVSALIAAAMTAAATAMLGQVDIVYLTVAAAFGFFLPDLRINEHRSKRTQRIVRELPAVIDFLVLGLEAGQNVTGALRLTLAKGPPGALRQEFARVLRDVSAGVPRAEALDQFQDRLGIKEVTALVNAMVQAERTGSSLVPILREQAAQRRTERFLLAEKKAFEAPVKMLGPLVIFIFPCTFAFLGYFLYQKIRMSGAF